MSMTGTDADALKIYIFKKDLKFSIKHGITIGFSQRFFWPTL
jgi:hypothetical protein